MTSLFHPIIPKLICGVVIRTPSGWLLGRRRSSGWWDLPKGRQDKGENALGTAMRECHEEFGLDLASHVDRLQDMGVGTYSGRRNRLLHVFLLDLPAAFPLSHCRPALNPQSPEMDLFAWVSEDQVLSYVRPRLARYLLARGLVKTSSNLPG